MNLVKGRKQRKMNTEKLTFAWTKMMNCITGNCSMNQPQLGLNLNLGLQNDNDM
jgi:hypothetical protein